MRSIAWFAHTWIERDLGYPPWADDLLNEGLHAADEFIEALAMLGACADVLRQLQHGAAHVTLPMTAEEFASWPDDLVERDGGQNHQPARFGGATALRRGAHRSPSGFATRSRSPRQSDLGMPGREGPRRQPLAASRKGTHSWHARLSTTREAARTAEEEDRPRGPGARAWSEVRAPHTVCTRC